MKHTKFDIVKSIHPWTTNFFAYIRLSVIISNVMIFAVAMSASSAELTITRFVNLINGSETDWHNAFSYVYLILMIAFIISTYLFLFIYVFFHPILVKRKYSVSLSKFEILSLSQYLIFGVIFIILLFVGFEKWQWHKGGSDWDLVQYMIPGLDLTVMLPTLILNIFCFIEHTWSGYIFHSKKIHIYNKYDAQFRITTNITTLVAISFVLVLWGQPESLFEDVGLLFTKITDPVEAIKYINIYLVIIFIIASFIFIIFSYGRRIRSEKLKRVHAMSGVETALNIAIVGAITVFLISTSVITMWATADKEQLTLLGLEIVDAVLVLPLFSWYIFFYSKNMKRVLHEL
ncbi:MAG: hypothetical protein LBS76_02775 [Mycoplasmataceae bacterium]|nr:hypothetical protein [Mycoplasmataceae bacterium]